MYWPFGNPLWWRTYSNLPIFTLCELPFSYWFSAYSFIHSSIHLRALCLSVSVSPPAYWLLQSLYNLHLPPFLFYKYLLNTRKSQKHCSVRFAHIILYTYINSRIQTVTTYQMWKLRHRRVIKPAWLHGASALTSLSSFSCLYSSCLSLIFIRERVCQRRQPIYPVSVCRYQGRPTLVRVVVSQGALTGCPVGRTQCYQCTPILSSTEMTTSQYAWRLSRLACGDHSAFG